MIKLPASEIPLGIAHFTTIDVEPLAFVEMASRVGYAAVGLRLYPAFPGAPFYVIPPDSDLMRAMKARLADTGIGIYDIEFVTLDDAFRIEPLKPILESAAELGACRLSVCGDIADHHCMVETFARVCDLAAEFDMGVDLEIMAWRQVATLAIAAEVVRRAGRANGGVLIDALHLSRSGGAPADLRGTPAAYLRSAQLCDAGATTPTSTEDIIREARGGRLAPGDGVLPLLDLLNELPNDVRLSVEVPNVGFEPEEHARRVYETARRTLEGARQNNLRAIGKNARK
jgi:sugar phosphate isomerase/epimerase